MSDIAGGQLAQDELIDEGNSNRIAEVVVFTDQAYLKRQGRVQAQEGLNRFLLEVRAFAVDRDSAQASVYGEGEILSVQYKEIPVKDAPQEEARALDARKDALARQRQALQNKKGVLEKQGRFLDSVIDFAKIEMPKELKTQFPDAESLQATLTFLDRSYQSLAEKDAAISQQIEQLDREISLVDKKLKRLRRPKEATRKAIEVLFESRKEQEVAIEASYVARGASWAPVYKVDVPLDLSRVHLTMFARIQQKTGEHWEQVKLAVSNAVPLHGATLPDLKSWYLDLPSRDMLMAAAGAALEETAPMRSGAGRKQSPDAAEAVFAGAMEIAELQPAAEFVQAAQKELPHAFEYELPQRLDIASADAETLLPLRTRAMDSELFIYAAPRVDPLAYLVCRAVADSALLAGRLNIHFGGRFVSGTALAEKKAGEDLLINLGAERGLKVRREKVTDKVTETFFGMVDRLSVAREFEYRILIENLKAEAVRVHLLDSLPVSKTDRIQTKGLEIVPEPAARDYQNRQGVMLWKLQLEPKAVKEIRIKFFLKYPKDTLPQGL